MRLIGFLYTAWKVSKYGIFSGPYFLAFGVSLRIKSECGKYGPAYLDTFHAVVAFKTSSVTGTVAFDISKVFGQDTAYYFFTKLSFIVFMVK